MLLIRKLVYSNIHIIYLNKENQMNQIRLHIWGDYACFTRPEMKVERVSYDVITPSAAGDPLGD